MMAWGDFFAFRDASPILGTRRYATNDGLYKMVIMMYLQKDSFRVLGEFLNVLRTLGLASPI
jgi:hypothetical protein